MGNNLPAKKYKSGQRTEKTLRYVFSVTDAAESNYIDLAQSLSAINRRFYRQGLYYYVQSITVHNSSNAWVRVNTLPDTWSIKNAWKRGFRIFQRMNSEALAATGASTPKYHDYKIAMNSAHDFANNMLPQGGSTTTAYSDDNDPSNNNRANTDDWVQSVYVSSDPDNAAPNHTVDEFKAHMLGGPVGSDPNFTSVGLLRSYQSARPLPQTSEPLMPSDFTTDPLTNLFDAGDSHDDILTNLDEDNDATPYDANIIWGESSNNHDTLAVQCSTSAGSGSVAKAGGFCAPFGLLRVVTQEIPSDGTTTIGDIEIVVKLAPGPYHGVYAERV